MLGPLGLGRECGHCSPQTVHRVLEPKEGWEGEAKPWRSDECMIALCETAGIFLVREGLILSSIRTECITFPQQVFTFTSFSEGRGLTLPRGKPPSLSMGESRRPLWTPLARSAPGTPPLGPASM